MADELREFFKMGEDPTTGSAWKAPDYGSKPSALRVSDNGDKNDTPKRPTSPQPSNPGGGGWGGTSTPKRPGQGFGS